MLMHIENFDNTNTLAFFITLLPSQNYATVNSCTQMG